MRQVFDRLRFLQESTEARTLPKPPVLLASQDDALNHIGSATRAQPGQITSRIQRRFVAPFVRNTVTLMRSFGDFTMT